MILCNDNRYSEKERNELKINEYTTVEKPFMDQLKDFGWNDGKNQVIELKMQQTPEESFRTNFKEVILKTKFKEAVKKINPFLTNDQIDDELIPKIENLTSESSTSLIENNRKILEILQKGTTVSKNEQTNEPNPDVYLIDYKNPENNIFTAISQFKVAIPGTEHHIIPDIVLFINGLPICIVECKSPKIEESIPEAIDQLMRYSEQRGDSGEGNQHLFYYNQFIVVTCRNEALFGTITTKNRKHFYRWADPYPLTVNDLSHGASAPNDQQRLVAGMLSIPNLLEIIRVFTVFSCDDKGRTIKIVSRYQQFRAVKKMAERLKTGKNPLERGGILWHTQGSGKSLTMMFLVRMMRLDKELLDWKIVFVTDRNQLEDQLGGTGISVGVDIKTAEFINPKTEEKKRGKSLKELLSTDNSDIVLAMIHKFQESGDLSSIEIFPELNASSKILIMTDEAHRSQYNLLGANLARALPNATRIGFTGTPTEKTEGLYRHYIDKYTMRESIDDDVTLEIVYQGFTHNAEITDKEAMDAEFEDVFSDYNIKERLQILGFGSKDAYLDSKETIKAKAKSMINHYVNEVFTNGFKAQVVANSRIAACRYKSALEEAIKEKVAELKQKNDLNIDIATLEKIKIAVIISASHNDEKEIKDCIDPQIVGQNYHERSITSFKLPFDGKDEDDNTIDGSIGILVVNNMLITGFDAPIEQVLYMDQVLKAHTLLQAICRPNRSGPEGKDYGFVVDYVGIAHHLKAAIENNDEREEKVDSGEIEKILGCISNNDSLVTELKNKHQAIWDFLNKYGLTDLSDEDAFYDTFYDEKIRSQWLNLYQEFSTAFNAVLPKKEALEFYKDWLSFTEINALALKYLRDKRFSMKGIPQKLRAIADEYLASKGIDVKVEPISILSDDFEKNSKKRKSKKSKAAEVEHAIRDFIDINIDDDPELFASYSKALEDIFERFADDWDKIYEELEKLRHTMKNREKEKTYGLRRKTQMPFFRIFKRELFDNADLNDDQITQNVALTVAVFEVVRTEVKMNGFWENSHLAAQNRLRAELQKTLISPEFCRLPHMMEKYSELISRVMELAKSIHSKIISENVA